MSAEEHQLFDSYYYRHGCGNPYERTPDWLQFFAAIADQIVARLGPKTVLDAGCALGFLVEQLRDRDVEAFGVDISSYALDHVRADIRPFCWQGSVVEPLPRRYDLIVCVEVLEHLPRADSERALANLCRHADDILFSSSPEDFREATHFNVQPPEYWAEQFALAGFARDVEFDATFILPWAARFRRQTDPWPRTIRAYERQGWHLSQENRGLRQQLQLREDQLRVQEAKIQGLEQNLNQITSGLGWQVLTSLRPLVRLAPPGSRRAQVLLRLLHRLQPSSSRHV